MRVSGTAVQPNYNSVTGEVIWDIGTLPGGSGVSFPKLEAYFVLSVTPSVNQVNQTLPLIRNARFDGADVYTKEKITKTVPDIFTSNMVDSKESGSVQP